MKRHLLTAATLAVAAMLTASANAAITHVDALGGTGGNTVNASNDSATDWFSAGSDANDGIWRERGTFGIGGTQIYENWGTSFHPPDQNSPDLKTTIAGLIAGTEYKVWVDYIRFGVFNDDPERGAVEAGLTLADDMTVFGAATGNGSAIGDSVANGLANSDRGGFRGYLGTAVADGSGEIDVFIGTNIPDGEERTWYDGVSYEVVPEPASLALLGLGGLLMLRRRRG